MVIDKFEEMIIGYTITVLVKKLYYKQPLIFLDKYLSHNVMFAYAGKKGFGFIIKVQRESMPKDVTYNYMHKYGEDTKSVPKLTR